MGAITYSPLAGGWLTGKYRRGVAAPADARANTLPVTAARFDPSVPENQHKFDVIDKLHVVAAEAGVPLATLAIAFAAEHPTVSTVLLGPRTEEQMTSLLESIDVRLDATTLDAIDVCVRPGETLNPLDRACATTVAGLRGQAPPRYATGVGLRVRTFRHRLNSLDHHPRVRERRGTDAYFDNRLADNLAFGHGEFGP